MSKETEIPRVLTGRHYTTGNHAAAEGALAADCTFFGGYPITPSSEIAEHMAIRLPQVNGNFVQFEDEIASIAGLLGAAWGGAKSMTATSGPGYSLMVENIGLGMMTETPCVIVNVQRGGPSTGLPTLVGQQDVMQAKWGSHGDFEPIAISPSNVQECFDLIIVAFNLSEQFRVPVTFLMDETLGHMSERLVIPSKSKVKIVNRKKPTVPPEEYLPYKTGKDLVPEMATAGEGYNVMVTGLTHDERGYPVITAEAQEINVKRINDKIRLNKDKIIMMEEFMKQILLDTPSGLLQGIMMMGPCVRFSSICRRKGLLFQESWKACQGLSQLLFSTVYLWRTLLDNLKGYFLSLME